MVDDRLCGEDPNKNCGCVGREIARAEFQTVTEERREDGWRNVREVTRAGLGVLRGSEQVRLVSRFLARSLGRECIHNSYRDTVGGEKRNLILTA